MFKISSTKRMINCEQRVTFKTNKYIHMKHIIIAFIFTGILMSCNSSDKKHTTTENSSEMETTEKRTSNDSIRELKSIVTDADLIATALLSAPEESRSESKVIGYNMKGEFVTLKEGSNEFIILADDPKKTDLVQHVIIKILSHSWQEEEI
jgi:hypothetical protein